MEYKSKTQQNVSELIDTENKLAGARSRDGEEVQNGRMQSKVMKYKSQRCNVQNGDYS